MWRAPALASLIIGAVVTSAASASASPTLLVKDSTRRFAVEPAQVVLTAGLTVAVIGGPTAWNGKGAAPSHPVGQFGRISWTSWARTRATGTAVEWGNSGRPTVANGTYVQASFNVVASRVRNGRFTRLTLTLRNGNPGRVTMVLQRTRRGYTWA
jgi:hypothetical protein